jgi:hypothetical protein
MSSAVSDLDPSGVVGGAVSVEANEVLNDTGDRTRQIVGYSFATLAGLGVLMLAAKAPLYVAIATGIPLVFIAAGCIHFASTRPSPESPCSRQTFRQELQKPETSFLTILQKYNAQALLKNGLIDQAHFDLLQSLNQRADKDISFPSSNRHVLTLYANFPEAYKAVIALDAEYKNKVLGQQPTPSNVDLEVRRAPVSPSEIKPPEQYVDARLKQAVYYAFALLSGLAAAAVAATTYFGVFKISMGFAIPFLVAALACLAHASKVIDYKNPDTQAKIRAEWANATFVDMYRKHGLCNLEQVFTASELKQKFNAEIRDPKTTFWNVLRRYDLQKLQQAGVISADFLNLLSSLRQHAEPLNKVISAGTIRTSFAKAPECFKSVAALDAAYRAKVEATL